MCIFLYKHNLGLKNGVIVISMGLLEGGASLGGQTGILVVLASP
jgi:hypothetical protein